MAQGGRPGFRVPEAMQEHVVALFQRRRGVRRIAKACGISTHQVRKVLASRGLSRGINTWTDKERELLREKAEEYGMARLKKTLGRAEDSIRAELSRMSIPKTHGAFTPSQIAKLTGRSEPTLLRAIARKELPARQQDGAWRTWPSELREWILDAPSRVDITRVEDWGTLAALLAGLLGDGKDTERRAARRARKAKGHEA